MIIEVLCSLSKKDYKKLFNIHFHHFRTIFLFKLVGLLGFGIWFHISFPYILKIINAIRSHNKSFWLTGEIITFFLGNLIVFIPFLYYLLCLYYLPFNRYWKAFYSQTKNFSYIKYTFFPHVFQVEAINSIEKPNLYEYDLVIFHFTKYGLIIDVNIEKPGIAVLIVPKVFFKNDDYKKLQEWYNASLDAF